VIVLTTLFRGINVNFIAAFHEAIKGAVLQIVALLKDKNWGVRSAGQKAMNKLFEHCK